MGNQVTYRRRPDLPDLKMSNGLTSAFVAVLSLAAADLAMGRSTFPMRM